MGFTFAQNDQILILLEYPLLLVLIWAASLCSLVMRLEHLRVFPPLFVVAWVVSHYIAQVLSVWVGAWAVWWAVWWVGGGVY